MSNRIDALPVETDPKGPVEFLELTWEERSKPRRRFVAGDGTEFALSLARGAVLPDGATVYNTGERTIVVRAKPERLLAVLPANVLQFCQVSHNLGNWHRSMQLCDDRILTHGDAPLEEWLNRNQIAFSYVDQPYEPNLCTHGHD